MVALVHYISLYGKKPVNVTYEKTGLSADEARIFWDIAWNTALNYPRSSVKATTSIPSQSGSGRLGENGGRRYPGVDGLGRVLYPQSAYPGFAPGRTPAFIAP